MQHIILHILLSNIVNIVVQKNKGLDNFVFNDNIDNVRQYLIVCSIDDVASLIVDHCLYCRSKTTY